MSWTRYNPQLQSECEIQSRTIFHKEIKSKKLMPASHFSLAIPAAVQHGRPFDFTQPIQPIVVDKTFDVREPFSVPFINWC